MSLLSAILDCRDRYSACRQRSSHAPSPRYAIVHFPRSSPGAVGAPSRYLLDSYIQTNIEGEFPWGTIAINAIGCLVIGLIAGLLASGQVRMAESGRLFLLVGVLGGFTTFSAYGLDTLTLLRGGHAGLAAANAVGQPIVGIAAVWLGFSVGSWRP